MSHFVTIGTFLTTIYRSLNGLINTYIVARIIDALIALIGTDRANIQGIIPLILLLGVVQLLSIISTNLDSYMNRYRRRLSQPYLAQLEYEKIIQLGVQTNQLPNVSNKRQVTHDWIYGLIDVNQNIVRIVAALIQSIVSAVIVFNFSIWIGILIILLALIAYVQNRYYFKKDFEWQTSDYNTQERRKAWWIHGLLSEAETMDEVSLVGGYGYLDKKFRSFFDYYISGYKKILKADSLTTFGVDFLNLFVVLGGSIQVFMMAFRKEISIGDTTFLSGRLIIFMVGYHGYLLSW